MFRLYVFFIRNKFMVAMGQDAHPCKFYPIPKCVLSHRLGEAHIFIKNIKQYFFFKLLKAHCNGSRPTRKGTSILMF